MQPTLPSITEVAQAGTFGLKLPALPHNPFVGLRPFNSDEALLFFGRREQAIDLLQKLHRTHFVAIVGSSGCGKSSLVRAGLIPKLKAGFLVEDRDQWLIATMKPGDAPMRNLAEALLNATSIGVPPSGGGARNQGFPPEGGTPDDETPNDRALEDAIIGRLEHAMNNSDANLLLLVDQFEEIFRFGVESGKAENRAEATRFVELMLALSRQRRLPIYVVMTMRSDFLGDCDNFYGLPEEMNRSQYLTPRLTREQLRQAVEGPINLFGGSVSPRLLDCVLNDAGVKSDQLPVMQHALMRTWERWQFENAKGGVAPQVDLPHYEAAGGIKHALSKDAEAALKGMSDDQLRITERMLQALTDTDARNRRVRRPAHLSEIEAITGADRGTILEIIERFKTGGRSFLTLTNDDDPLIDISHESLIRQWNRLVEWIDGEAGNRETYLRIVDAAKRYQKGETQLWRNPDLQLAFQWRKKIKPNADWALRYNGVFKFDAAMAFLEKSRRRQVYRNIAACTLVGLILIVSAALIISFQKRQAKLQFEILEKENKSLQATQNLTEGIEQTSDGDIYVAISKFSGAISYRQDYADAYFYRGNAYLQLGDKEKAEADFKKYLELDGTPEKKSKAQRFIQAITGPKNGPPPPPTDLGSQERCAALIEQMFDDNKETRIAATSTLISTWKNFPLLIPLVIKKAKAEPSNKSGISNALLILGNADPKYMKQYKMEITQLANEVEKNGVRTKDRADKLRVALSQPSPIQAKP